MALDKWALDRAPIGEALEDAVAQGENQNEVEGEPQGET